MDKSIVHTIFGMFCDNELTTLDGKIIPCITYGSVRNQINNKEGFYNLKWSDDIDQWIIFQFALV